MTPEMRHFITEILRGSLVFWFSFVCHLVALILSSPPERSQPLSFADFHPSKLSLSGVLSSRTDIRRRTDRLLLGSRPSLLARSQ